MINYINHIIVRQIAFFYCYPLLSSFIGVMYGVKDFECHYFRHYQKIKKNHRPFLHQTAADLPGMNFFFIRMEIIQD